MYTEQMSQRMAVLGTIDPQDYAANTSTTTVTSDVIDMSVFRRVMFILSVGTLGTACTVDMTVNKGTATATVTTSHTAITQLTTADDNKQVIVEVTAEKVEPNRYVNAVVTAANGGAGDNEGFSLVVLGGDCRHGPAVNYDLSTVDEIIVN